MSKPSDFVVKQVEEKDPVTGELLKVAKIYVKCSGCGRLIDTLEEPYYILGGRILCEKCYCALR